MTIPQIIVHPVTGEVIEDPRHVAREWTRIQVALEDANREVNALVAARAALEPAMRACAEALGRVDADDSWVVLQPPARRAAQRVDQVACQRYAEELDALAIGRTEVRWVPPTAAEVRKHAARLAAAGIPLAELLPEPTPEPDIIVIVPKEVTP